MGGARAKAGTGWPAGPLLPARHVVVDGEGQVGGLSEGQQPLGTKRRLRGGLRGDMGLGSAGQELTRNSLRQKVMREPGATAAV